MEFSHRRKNILTGEWVQVSPHRSKRPWQGKQESIQVLNEVKHDPSCYLCPGNERIGGQVNPAYQDCYVFENDFAALRKDVPFQELNEKNLLIAKSEKGICKVLCFSPRHDLSLAQMQLDDIVKVVKTWKEEYESLGQLDYINYVQIFENKGELMGCSNPHPHGQIWAQESLPQELIKEQQEQLSYYNLHNNNLLQDYLKVELNKDERIVYQNDGFVVLVPYWAIWPFETLILPKSNLKSLSELNEKLCLDFADSIQHITQKYDQLFACSFPYSAGIHQAPTDGEVHEEWTMHMHFYPPLLRSAQVKKFMVGYEMLANPQRDFTPELAAEMLKKL